MYTYCDSIMPYLSCTCLCITAKGVCLHLLAPSLAQCCFFGASCYCRGILSRERHLCNNFIQKRRVGLFSRVGLFLGDYSTGIDLWITHTRTKGIVMFLLRDVFKSTYLIFKTACYVSCNFVTRSSKFTGYTSKYPDQQLLLAIEYSHCCEIYACLVSLPWHLQCCL